MNIKTKEIYSEVYQVLNLLGDEYINKLPRSLYNMIKEKRDINYIPQYTEDLPLNQQNIQKNTLAIITLLHLNYWCEDDNEKYEIKRILKENENKYQEEIRNKYNPNDIFKQINHEEQEQIDIAKKQISMIEYKESFFKKIINKIKNFFNIN